MKKTAVLVILIIVCIFGYFRLRNKPNPENDPITTPDVIEHTTESLFAFGMNETDFLTKYMTEAEESDQELIEARFAAGMEKADFLAIFDKEPVYLKKDNGGWNADALKYDFEAVLPYASVENMILLLNTSAAVKVEIIGQSLDKRNIYAIEIGFGERVIMFEAGIHAAETANTMFIMKYISNLVTKYEEHDSAVVSLLKDVKIIVVPSANPDGYEATMYGYSQIRNDALYIVKNNAAISYALYKSNAGGIDINRNFPSQHGGLYYTDYGLSNNASLGDDDYAGNTLGCEPETQALMYWQMKHVGKAYAYISLHSSGRVIFAGKPNLGDQFNDNCWLLANIVSDITDYWAIGPEYEDVGIGQDGTATDFVAELAAGFKFSSTTGRLSGNHYDNPTISGNQAIGVITLETLERYTFNISEIKEEYYGKNLEQVFDALIKSYTKIKSS